MMTIDEFINRIDVANDRFPYECEEALEKPLRPCKRTEKRNTG